MEQIHLLGANVEFSISGKMCITAYGSVSPHEQSGDGARIYWTWQKQAPERSPFNLLIYILVAEEFADSMEVPPKLWHTMQASICWQIWKRRNELVFVRKPFNSEAVIRKFWHRVGTYIRLEWPHLMTEVRNRKMSFMEARERLAFLYGAEGVTWNLDEIGIQIPPYPPRPPWVQNWKLFSEVLWSTDGLSGPSRIQWDPPLPDGSHWPVGGS